MTAFHYRASADRERTNKSYFSSVQPLPGENLPVNLTQIAHDLDAKLLEFTLMAKARERVSEEAHSAAEAEKSAWKEGETKRLEDEVRSLLLYTPIMLRGVRPESLECLTLLFALSGFLIVWQVRQEHAILHNAASREDSVLPMAKGLSEPFDLLSPLGYVSDWDSLSLRNLSTRHPALPPSALGGYTNRFPSRTDAPVEVIASQMAGILRAVEAKVRQIKVSGLKLAVIACTRMPHNEFARTQSP